MFRSALKKIKHRRLRAKLLATLPKHAVCAEIGVWRGEFSREILERTSPKELHLIDPWAFQPQFPKRWYGGRIAKSQRDMDSIHDGVAAAFKAHPEVVIHRGPSAEVLPEFPEAYFDWTYVDGDHEFDGVMTDLELSRQKVRKGGFIVGDDLDWGPELGLPVRRAMDEFATKHGLQPKIMGTQFVIQV